MSFIFGWFPRFTRQDASQWVWKDYSALGYMGSAITGYNSQQANGFAYRTNDKNYGHMMVCADLIPYLPGIFHSKTAYCLKWAGAPKAATDAIGLDGCKAAFAQLDGWSEGDWYPVDQTDSDGKRCKYPVQILIGNEGYSVVPGA